MYVLKIYHVAKDISLGVSTLKHDDLRLRTLSLSPTKANFGAKYLIANFATGLSSWFASVDTVSG